MNLRNFCYRYITEKMNYNNDLSFGVSLDMTLKDVVKNTIDYVDKYNMGNSFHASLCLMKMLENVGIKSEMLFRIGKIRINGRFKNSFVVSVLVKDRGNSYVMNPIEDIEFFSKEKVEKDKRRVFYDVDTTSFKVIKSIKRDIWSEDAGRIEIDDYVNRYGEGRVWNVGNLFRNDADKITLGDVIRDARVIKSLDKKNVKTIK